MGEYVWEVAAPPEELVHELMRAGAITQATALVLAHRGVAVEDVGSFLTPSLSSLSDPFRLPGTVAAAERLWNAIHAGERILVHGDYDADGVTAAVLLAGVLRDNGALVECFLPHRIDDGYGLTTESIVKAVSEGYKLLVTVDCGITSVEAAESARAQGLELIITDHHMPGDTLPPALAAIDPKLPGAAPEVGNLAGVGVAFKVCHAFLKYGRENGRGGMGTDLREGLDLVALGTVADIVPLLHENRAMVRYGLEVLSRQQRPGIHALCEISGVTVPVRTTDITYRLAPRLNAAGRMGDPIESYKLLESSSMQQATELGRVLDDYNRARQQIEEAALVGAEAQIAERCDLEHDRSIVVWHDDWHQGVVGIVASRLARRYHRPSVVLTRDPDGFFTGSGRGVRRVNLVSLMEKCAPILIRYGGHAMAAGLSLPGENLPQFCSEFEAAVQQVFGADAMRPQIEACGRVTFGELNDDFFAELDRLEPFGHGNPEPIFVTDGVFPDRKDPAGRDHTRGWLIDRSGRRISFIAFNIMPDELPPGPWKLAYTPHINRFMGRATPQVRVIDVKPEQ